MNELNWSHVARRTIPEKILKEAERGFARNLADLEAQNPNAPSAWLDRKEALIREGYLNWAWARALEQSK
jgi:hypothetical protein